MKNIYKISKSIIKGDKKITAHLKFAAILYCVSAVHLCFLIFFFCIDIMPMILYNIYSLLFYQAIAHLFHKDKIFLCATLSTFEVIVHSVFSTVMLGWNYGFMLYMIALIPTAIFISFTSQNMKYKKAYQIIISTTVIVVSFATYFFCRSSEPMITIHESWVQLVLYLFNLFIAFAFISIFTIMFSMEISEIQNALRKQNIHLDSISKTDPLTTLLNRRSMTDHMNTAVRNAQENGSEFCLNICDIDDFKKVNDTYGHECGDRVLVHIANIMKKNCRQLDSICRWGGEEFLLLISADSKISENIADDYLYYGKEHGKNTVVTDKQLQVKI